jgi:hypothetical protein
VRGGEPLSVESLCEAYGKLNEKYYPGVVVDDEIKIEWARIPHFYNAFYVYQYATGFCAAVALARGILEGKGLDAYLAFLKSGGSDFPIALLQKAGVDLTKPESILTSLDEFDSWSASWRSWCKDRSTFGGSAPEPPLRGVTPLRTRNQSDCVALGDSIQSNHNTNRFSCFIRK